MKTFSVELAASYAGASTTLCQCLRVLRRDGMVQTYATLDQDVTVGGEVYAASPGLDLSSIVDQSGAAVGNGDLTLFPDEVELPKGDIEAGRWDFAQFWIFEIDYLSTTIAAGTGLGVPIRDDVNLLKRGTTGEVDLTRTATKLEFRSLKQAWQQNVGAVTSKTCRARLGDELCTVDLTPWTHDYATTSVISRGTFSCSAAAEADDYYGEGTATGLTGANEGFSQKVATFSSGDFVLSLPMPYAIGVGDSFRFVAGCRKRLIEDCKTKFANVLNFQGEPHVPGTDALTSDPDIGGS